MRVHVFTVCWNEELVLPYFFKHYKERFSNVKFTIFDNYSTDASRQIIEDNGGQIVDFGTTEFRDDINMDIKNNCWKNADADWVVVCDMDEWIECDDAFLENTLSTIVKPHGYEMVGFSYNLDKIVRGLRYKKYDKCILFKPGAINEMNYGAGCHKCNPVGNLVYNTETIPMYHMKFFHPVYLIKRYKILAKRLSQINKDNMWGFTYTKSIKDILKRYILVRKNSVKIRSITKSTPSLVH